MAHDGVVAQEGEARRYGNCREFRQRMLCLVARLVEQHRQQAVRVEPVPLRSLHHRPCRPWRVEQPRIRIVGPLFHPIGWRLGNALADAANLFDARVRRRVDVPRCFGELLGEVSDEECL